MAEAAVIAPIVIAGLSTVGTGIGAVASISQANSARDAAKAQADAQNKLASDTKLKQKLDDQAEAGIVARNQALRNRRAASPTLLGGTTGTSDIAPIGGTVKKTLLGS